MVLSEFSFGSPYADQIPGRTIRFIGWGMSTGGGVVPGAQKSLEMYFVTNLPPENVEVLETTGPLEVAYGATARL